MKVTELRTFLGEKSEGPWELMATAVGVPQSVRKTRHALSAGEIRKGAIGDAISPAVIDSRIQALAAFDAVLLEETMSTWLPPEELRGLSKYEVEADFWLAAWCAALRFAPRLQLLVARIPGLPQPLQDECRVITNMDAGRGVSESVAKAIESDVSYNELRMISRHVVPDEDVSPAHIDLLVGDEEGPGRIERLRVLLRRDLVFSEPASRRVAQLFHNMWRSRAGGESGAGLILTELVCERGASEPAVLEAMHEIGGRLASDGPMAWQRTAYLLARTNWTCR